MLSRTPRLLADFDGSFDNLPRGSIQTLGLFERPHVLVCERERYLLLCAMPDGVVCGERDRRSGGLKAETLVVEMEPCFHIVKQFWWLSDRTQTWQTCLKAYSLRFEKYLKRAVGLKLSSETGSAFIRHERRSASGESSG